MATTRRADMFIDLNDDPRENGPTLGDERTTLVEAVRCCRLTSEMKCSGLDAGARRAEVDFATRFVVEAPSLDITGNDPENQRGSRGGQVSLREALVGTIHEYARHTGHADLLRERIDGRIGQ